MERAYALWRAFQDRILERATAIVFLGCTLLALLEVVRRYLLGLSFEWQQDAVTLFILSAVFLYFGVSQRRGAHLNVNLLTGVLEELGPRAARAAEIIRLLAEIFSFVFLVAIVWWGVPDIKDSVTYGSRSESLAFPMWPFLMALLVGFALMAVSLFFQIYRSVQKLRGRTVLAEPFGEGAPPH
ncbi:MAG TPA: TRAP transporter small permease [Burkholderiales bacterium]|nr:TRAP transporter small permease [Burkholderiales bacterium]